MSEAVGMTAVTLVALSCSKKRQCQELGALGHLQGSLLMPFSSFEPLGYLQGKQKLCSQMDLVGRAPHAYLGGVLDLKLHC